MDYARMLFRSLWSIILIVFLIIAFDIPVYIATPLVTVLNMFVDRLKWWEIRPMFFTAFEPVIIFNTVLIMVFKDIITSTGVIHELPVFFGGLPVPLPLVFALIFFFGTIISGSNAIISPVSYTHLDVYKRQISMRSAISSAAIRPSAWGTRRSGNCSGFVRI